MDPRSESCNRAVLVSVIQFDPDVGLGRRPGAKRDNKSLHRTLRELGFSVELHNDLSAQEIQQLFLAESRRPVRDCFLAVLSSHGDEGCVYGADGNAVQLSRIFSYFDNKLMENKAKVFLVQACRGGALDDGVEVDSALRPGSEAIGADWNVPVDTVVMYATPPGYAAFSHPLGSVFLQTLCELLGEEGGRDLELTRLLTRLSHRVAFHFQSRGRRCGGKKAMPCLLTRMTRDVFPFARPAKHAGLGVSATALVQTSPSRTRTRSIS